MEQHILDTVKDSYVYNTYEMYTKKQPVSEDTFWKGSPKEKVGKSAFLQLTDLGSQAMKLQGT